MIMKFKLKTLIVTISIILMIALVWFLIGTDFSLLHKSKPGHYDSFMTNVHGIKLDKLGNPHSELYSPNMKHYLKNDTTIAVKPKFIFYSKDGPPWHVKADHGKATNGDKLIYLWGNVYMRQLPGPGSHDATITTTSATLYPDRSYAETDQPVTVRQPGSIMHGVGMQANLKKGTIKILSKTKGMYGDIPKTSK